ncbi:MAG: sulfotransferase [Saprospiraceae bacterium]|nr:sulfotransferase [Saprospiraceae bacterium]
MSENLVNSSPFFLVGSPRSGTTLLEVILDCHSKVAVCPEIFTGRLLWRLNANDKLSNEWQSLLLLNAHFKLSKHFLDPLHQCLANQALKKISYPTQTENWYHQFITDYLNVKHSCIYGEKTPENSLFLPTITRAFPDAKYLVILRNPFDIVLSLSEAVSKKLKIPITESLLLRFAVIVKRALNELYIKQRLKHQKAIWFTYEDLVENPKKTLDAICDFLSIAFEHQMLEFQDRKKFIPEHETMKLLHYRLNKPITTDRINRSSDLLTSQQISLLQRYLTPEIDYLPYVYTQNRTSLSLRNKVRVTLAKVAFKLRWYMLEEIKNKIRFQLHYYALLYLRNTPLRSFIFKNLVHKKEQWEEVITAWKSRTI